MMRLRNYLSVTKTSDSERSLYTGFAINTNQRSDLRKHEIRNHNRMKRDYIGGEPTYKQVERLQKLQENEEMDKWRAQEMTITQVPVAQNAYIDQPKEFIANHALYFPDVGMIQQQQIVQQQTVELTLPELALKKDEVKLYETQQTIGYF